MTPRDLTQGMDPIARVLERIAVALETLARVIESQDDDLAAERAQERRITHRRLHGIDIEDGDRDPEGG